MIAFNRYISSIANDDNRSFEFVMQVKSSHMQIFK